MENYWTSKSHNEDTNILIKRIAESDDHTAFRIFYDRYYLQIYRFSSYFVKSSQLREEIVSDVFCIIWQNRKKLAGIENFEAYLYTITKNKALRYLHDEYKLSSVETEPITQDIIFHNENPEYLAIDEEISIAFEKAVNELPEKCRTIFRMAREKNLKYKQIADILSISEKTVNTQMVLAIKKLAKKMGHIVFFIM